MAENKPKKEVHHMRTFHGDAKNTGIVFAEKKVPEAKEKNPYLKDSKKPLKQTKGKENSILTNKDDVFDVSRAFKSGTAGGTIVTDKKRKRLSIGEALLEAGKEWFGMTKKNIAKTGVFVKKEEPKVATTENREATITEAARHAKHAPQDDHSVVVEKLKTLKQDAERITGKPYLAKNKKTQKQTWTHIKNTDDEKKNLPTKKEAENEKEEAKAPRAEEKKVAEPKTTELPDFRKSTVAPTVKARSKKSAADYTFNEKLHSYIPEQKQEPISQKESGHDDIVAKNIKEKIAPKVSPSKSLGEEVTKVEASEQKTKEKEKTEWSFFNEKEDETKDSIPEDVTPVPVKPPVEKQEIKQQPPQVPTATPRSQIVSPSFHSNTSNVTVDQKPQLAPEPNIKPLPASSQQKPDERKHTVRTFLFALVILVSIGAGISAALFLVKQQGGEPPASTPTVVITSFIPVEQQTRVPLGSSKVELLSTIKEAVDHAENGLTQVYPTEKETGEPADTIAILDVLVPRMPGSFERSLESEMMTGAITTDINEPFVLLRSHTFDTAFAGMIAWEPYMSEDLAPLFGAPVLYTRNVNPGGITSVKDAHFTDAIKDNKSIRILYDETGNERIVYAFVNRDTIVITSSTEALTNIISRF